VKKVLVLGIVVAFVLLGAVLALQYVDNYAAFWRMRETPAVRPHEEPLLIMEEGAVPVSDAEAFLRLTDADDLKSPFNLDDPGAIKSGKELYFAFCAQCHGRNYDGNGTVGQSFAPLPTDLKSKKVQSMLAGKLFKDISYGVPKGRQPPLATTIDIKDRWRIIAFVKSLGLRE
jgi:mono/diheme cytochrome c family protein